jgi:hypothetical protein
MLVAQELDGGGVQRFRENFHALRDLGLHGSRRTAWPRSSP